MFHIKHQYFAIQSRYKVKMKYGIKTQGSLGCRDRPNPISAKPNQTCEFQPNVGFCQTIVAFGKWGIFLPNVWFSFSEHVRRLVDPI